MEVKRKPNESTGSLMRRFSRLVQQSRIIVNAKKARYVEKKPNERVLKNRAIMREELRSLRKRLERLGKYDDDSFEEEKKKIKRKLNL
jgi:ribosomal protein S21